MYQLRELTTKKEMLEQLEILLQVYPEFTMETYGALLDDMLPKDYQQLIVVDNGKTIGISGYWIGTKLWCGKYLELDNVVVHNEYRSKGIGKLINVHLEKKAIEQNCTMLALDAYTTNFGAQKFYMNQGFVPKGFHFVKMLK